MPENSPCLVEPPHQAVSRFKNVVAFALLVLATVHCVLSYFFVNQSGINLRNYANGAETLTFQGRLLMSFTLRATQHSAFLASLAVRFTHHVPTPEPNSVYKVTSILVALPCALLLGCALTWYSRRAGLRPWWLPWSLLLAIFYVSLAAKYEQNLWYPYDLPHIAVFGLATICIFPMSRYGFCRLSSWTSASGRRPSSLSSSPLPCTTIGNRREPGGRCLV